MIDHVALGLPSRKIIVIHDCREGGIDGRPDLTDPARFRKLEAIGFSQSMAVVLGSALRTELRNHGVDDDKIKTFVTGSISDRDAESVVRAFASAAKGERDLLRNGIVILYEQRISFPVRTILDNVCSRAGLHVSFANADDL